jgi:hypothetical protein
MSLHGCFGFPLGVIVTQMPKQDLDVLVQRREPLGFFSGTFNRYQKHWSVIEKEALPIVEAVKRLRHLLLRDEGFRLFTDDICLRSNLERQRFQEASS